MEIIKLLSLVVVLVLMGCEPNIFKDNIVICPEDPTALAEFILVCAKNANPLSDEEGEDLVKECRFSGIKVFCSAEKGFRIGSGHTIPCEEAFTQKEKNKCGIR